MLEQDRLREFDNILKKAVEFHGHFGPFLVIGVRMSLIGLRELRSEKGNKKLRAAASLTEYSVPFSCVLDGIQVATGFTFGNQRLTLKKAPNISAEFQLPRKKQVTVTVHQSAFNRLKRRLLSEKLSDNKIEELARLVASTPEKDLFAMKKE